MALQVLTIFILLGKPHQGVASAGKGRGLRTQDTSAILGFLFPDRNKLVPPQGLCTCRFLCLNPLSPLLWQVWVLIICEALVQLFLTNRGCA